MKDFVKQAKQLVWNNEIESFIRQDPEMSANVREKGEGGGDENQLFETGSEVKEGGKDNNQNNLIRISNINKSLLNLNCENLIIGN